MIYACKTIDEEPGSKSIYSQGKLLDKAQEHWGKMLKKYNKKTRGALLFRHIHPQWHRNSIVKEGIYNHEYLKVVMSKNKHYNVEMYYNATGKEQKGFFKVWKHASRTFGLFDLEGKMLNYGYFDKSTKPKYIQLYPKVKSNSSQSKTSGVSVTCFSCGNCCTECIVLYVPDDNGGGGSSGTDDEFGEESHSDGSSPYDSYGSPDPFESFISPVIKDIVLAPPTPFIPPSVGGAPDGNEGDLPEPKICDSPSPANRLDDINNMPPEKTGDVQKFNTCVLKTLEWIAGYYENENDLNDFLLYVATKLKNPNAMFTGLDVEEIELLLREFTTFSNILPQDVNNAIINNDHPVMAFYKSGIDPLTNKPFGHEVMITGVSDDGKYFRYFDPQLGEYRCLPKEDFEDFREIKGFK